MIGWGGTLRGIRPAYEKIRMIMIGWGELLR